MSERQDDEPRITDRRASTMPESEGAAARGDLPLDKQLEEAEAKAQSFYASWQRAAADFQNYKRRVDQEREETARFASAAVIINILPVMDDLERALQNVDANLAGLTWVDGIRLIQRKFQAVLEISGLKEIEADGASFDPNFHEAVAFGPGEEGKVISVVQKGYTLNGRVLRPAMVVVGKGKEQS
ncbi:MAG TPA: nucleotide exchange factor GrpE [Dehalococcoidia bacterium]|jgi:molecular chaperone GrpE